NNSKFHCLVCEEEHKKGDDCYVLYNGETLMFKCYKKDDSVFLGPLTKYKPCTTWAEVEIKYKHQTFDSFDEINPEDFKNNIAYSINDEFYYIKTHEGWKLDSGASRRFEFYVKN